MEKESKNIEELKGRLEKNDSELVFKKKELVKLKVKWIKAYKRNIKKIIDLFDRTRKRELSIKSSNSREGK